MKETIHYVGDRGDTSQWITLFPNKIFAGEGILDLKTIFQTVLKNVVSHFFAGQDMVENPSLSLKSSFDYLSSI